MSNFLIRIINKELNLLLTLRTCIQQRQPIRGTKPRAYIPDTWTSQLLSGNNFQDCYDLPNTVILRPSPFLQGPAKITIKSSSSHSSSLQFAVQKSLPPHFCSTTPLSILT